ncbi:MAG: Quinolone resistance protein NorB [Firmicutes bacterium]|nr:Quinolone resistance protein NorB [Bacillota bacterium]
MGTLFEYGARIKAFSRNARLFLLAGLLGALYQQVYGVLGNLFLLEAGLSADFLGLMIAVSSVSNAVFSLPAGMLSDRFGRKRVVISGALLAITGQLILVLWPTPSLALLSALIAGAGGAVLMVSTSPFLAENSTAEERAHLFSVNAATWTVSGVIGSFLGGALPLMWARIMGSAPDSLIAYRLTLFTALFLLAVSVVPYYALEERREPKRATHREKLRLVLPSRELMVRLLVPEIILGFGAGMIIPFLNVYFARQLGASAAQIGGIFSVMSLVTTVALLCAPLLEGRYGTVKAAVYTRILSVPLLLTIALTNTLWIGAVAAWFRSALMNASMPLVSKFNMEVASPGERATLSSLVSMTWTVGWALGARLGGRWMEIYSYNFPYFFTAALYVISAFVFYYFCLPLEEKLQNKG